MKNNFNKKITVAFRWSIFFLLLCSTVSLVIIYKAEEKEHWVGHTYQVIERLEFLLSSVKDAETGVRGYAITHDTATLQPYYDARHVVDITLSEVRSLTSDNPVQQRSLKDLSLLIAHKFAILSLDTERVHTGQTVSPLLIAQGKIAMDEIRTNVNTMRNREFNLLTNRQNAWRGTWGLVPFFIITLTVVGFLTTTYFCRNLKITYFDKVRFRRKLHQEVILTKNRINIIQTVTGKIASGNYKVSIQGRERETLGTLADDLNQMSASLDYSFTRIREWLDKRTS